MHTASTVVAGADRSISSNWEGLPRLHSTALCSIHRKRERKKGWCRGGFSFSRFSGPSRFGWSDSAVENCPTVMKCCTAGGGPNSALNRYLSAHELGCCSLFAGTSFIIFVTLLPLMIDPSVLTFVLHLVPAACLTVAAVVLNGTSNCAWTSCQQACTAADIFQCWHLNVSYLVLSEDLVLDPPGSDPPPVARLYPNVAGCGYPPDVDCDQFFRRYALPSAFEQTYPCFVSLSDPGVAVIHADTTEAAVHLAVGFTPLLLFLAMSLYVALRLRCRRHSNSQIRVVGLKGPGGRLVLSTSADIQAAEQARKVLESKRLLESRKQTWLNAFRQDRVSSTTPNVQQSSPPPPPPPQSSKRKPPDLAIPCEDQLVLPVEVTSPLASPLVTVHATSSVSSPPHHCRLLMVDNKEDVTT